MYAPVALRFLTYGIPVAPPAAEWVRTLTDDPPVRRWLAAAAAEPEVIAAEERG
jgi:glutathione S-transferase